MTLPYSRTVRVTMSRNDAFPARRGFGTPLLLINTAIEDVLDVDNRTKLYASMDEVDADWAADSEPYKAALAAFSQNPRPIQIKFGYVAGTPGTMTAAEMQTQLGLIFDADQDWYFVNFVRAFRDTVAADGVVAWVQAQSKMAILDSNAETMTVASDDTNIAARHKGTVDRTAIFWHPDVDLYGGFALAAKLSTFNFDEANSAYTAKFKQLLGISPVNIGSAAVTAASGFTPQLGQAVVTGHLANTYVDIGGQPIVVEGSTLRPNVFIDEIHATDWIIARTEEEILGVLIKNKRVPYTDAGIEQLVSAIRIVMQQAIRAGLIAEDLNPVSGLYEAAIEYIIPSVFDVPESQRKARIAPDIQVRFRYAGAVHYVVVNYQMTF